MKSYLQKFVWKRELHLFKKKMLFALYKLVLKSQIPVKRNTEMESDTAECFIMKYNNSPKHSFLNEFLFSTQHLGPQK